MRQERDLHVRIVFEEKTADLVNRDGNRLIRRIAVDAGADQGKGNAVKAPVPGDPEGISVAGAEKFFLPVFPVLIDRPDGVDDVLCRKAVAFRDFCLPGRTAAELPALREKPRPRGLMDRAVHAPAAEKRRVGGVYDGVNA